MSLEIKHAILDVLLASLDEEHALGIIEHRRVKKVPLTVLAAKILAKQFALCPDPNAAAEEMINRGWTGFKADWLRRQSPPRPRNSVVDAMNDIFRERGWSNEPECIPGNNGDGERFPAKRNGQEGASVDLREGADWYRGPSHH